MLFTDEAIIRLASTTIMERADRCNFCNEKVYKLSKREYYVRCSWKFCKKEYSVLNGTLFENSKISFIKKLRILELWSLNLSNHQISSILGIDKKSVATILSLMKKQIVDSYYSSLYKIGGQNIIVEIDESKFGKRKYNRGRIVDGVWVLGMVERTPQRRIFLTEVMHRNSSTLKNLINERVERESIIYTDLWKGYTGIEFTHGTVNHSKYFVDPVSRVHTNTIEGNWRVIKAETPNRCRTRNLVKAYLVRFMIKRNESGELLANLIKYIF